ncbi:helix-turn-helix domain-containing protein [Halorubrum sp. DTA98]|uniref:helix-turn-helix domain-containing protein n=1 Tax=Halorubrum sp. DTA98 TaxID=3402163 RepID=UPI003AADD19C
MVNTPQDADEYTELVDRNGLVKLFANRVRARILATLLYADEPLTVDRIAAGAGVTRSVVHEALDPLARFGVLDERPTEADDVTAFALDDDDELVASIRRIAELSTERFYDE